MSFKETRKSHSRVRSELYALHDKKVNTECSYQVWSYILKDVWSQIDSQVSNEIYHKLFSKYFVRASNRRKTKVVRGL